METSGRNKAVQKTNDSCIISKCSMSKYGYFKDSAVQFFVDKEKRRSPLIHRGYYVRAKALQKTFDDFFFHHPGESQILSLGAGFDTTYFRLTLDDKLPPNCVYFEVDFYEVARNKLNIIVNNEMLVKCINLNDEKQTRPCNSIVLNTNKYKLIGNNLKYLHKLDELLEECDFKWQIPTLVISECVLTYLNTKSSADIIKWVGQKCPNAVFFTYEQILSSNNFGYVMMNHFESIGSSLKGIQSSCDSQMERFLKNGWEDCLAVDMNKFTISFIDDEEQNRIDKLEPFDEIEELHLKCNHYTALWATQGICKKFTENLKLAIIHLNESECDLKSPVSTLSNFSSHPSNILRFGHSSAVHSSFVLSFGGFGYTNGHHQRLSDIHFLDLNTYNQAKLPIENTPNSKFVGLLHHTVTVLKQHHLGFMIFGGRSSPEKASNSSLFFPFSSFKELFVELRQTGKNQYLNFTSEISNPTFIEIEQKGEIPCPRWRHSASVVCIDGCEYIIVFGGCSVLHKYLSDCYMLNTSTWRWKKISTSINQPSPRHSHSSVTWRHNMIVSCGLGRNNQPLNSIHILNSVNMTWMDLKTLNVNPRYSHSSHVWNDKLYLIGGVNCYPLRQPQIEIIDLINKTSAEYNLLSLLQPPMLIHNHTSVISEENKEIVILGGGGNCFSFGTYLNSTLICVELESSS